MRITITALLYIFVLTSSLAQAKDMSMISGADGQKYQAIIAGPENSEIGIVIVHDWFGVTELTKASTLRFANKGARVIAIDLYKGQTAKTHDEAKKLQKSLDSNHAQKAIQAALKTLNKNNRRIAIIGYSAGGKFALRAAFENSQIIKATALIYGGGYAGELKNTKLTKPGPILAIYGSEDKWSTKSYNALQSQMHKLKHPIETYIYPGVAHAFAQKLFNEGKNYNQDATDAMRDVLDDFLKRQLKIKFKAKP